MEFSLSVDVVFVEETRLWFWFGFLWIIVLIVTGGEFGAVISKWSFLGSVLLCSRRRIWWILVLSSFL